MSVHLLAKASQSDTIFILPCEFGLAPYVRSMLLLDVSSDVHSILSKMLPHFRQCFFITFFMHFDIMFCYV